MLLIFLSFAVSVASVDVLGDDVVETLSLDGIPVDVYLVPGQGVNTVPFRDVAGTDLGRESPFQTRLFHRKQESLAIDAFSVDEMAYIGTFHLETEFPWCVYKNFYGVSEFIPGAECSSFATYNSDSASCNNTCIEHTLRSNDAAAIYWNGKHARKYNLSPPNETVSEMLIVTVLIAFLSVWLDWMRGATDYFMQKSPDLSDAWVMLHSRSDIIADMVLLSLSTLVLSVASRHPTLHSEELFHLFGSSSQTLIEIFGYGMFPLFAGITLLGLLFAFRQNTPDTFDTVPPWFDFSIRLRYGAVVLFFMAAVLVTVVVVVMRRLFNDTVSGTVVGAVLSAVFLIVVSSKRRILHFFTPVLKRMSPILVLLAMRLAFETLLFVTLHANLPVVFQGEISVVYKNGIGFAIGLSLCFIAGRDTALIIRETGRGVYLAVLLLLGVVSYAVIIMIAPALSNVRSLYHHREETFLVGSAFALQLVAAGCVWAAMRFRI